MALLPSQLARGLQRLNRRCAAAYQKRQDKEDEKQPKQHLRDSCGGAGDAAEAEDPGNKCDDEKGDCPR